MDAYPFPRAQRSKGQGKLFTSTCLICKASSLPILSFCKDFTISSQIYSCCELQVAGTSTIKILLVPCPSSKHPVRYVLLGFWHLSSSHYTKGHLSSLGALSQGFSSLSQGLSSLSQGFSSLSQGFLPFLKGLLPFLKGFLPFPKGLCHPLGLAFPFCKGSFHFSMAIPFCKGFPFFKGCRPFARLAAIPQMPFARHEFLFPFARIARILPFSS